MVATSDGWKVRRLRVNWMMTRMWEPDVMGTIRTWFEGAIVDKGYGQQRVKIRADLKSKVRMTEDLGVWIGSPDLD